MFVPLASWRLGAFALHPPNYKWPAPVHFVAPRRTMTRNPGFEITDAGPHQSLAQIHSRNDDGPPLLAFRNGFAFVVVNGRQHPVARDVLVSAADEIDVVFARARAGEHRVAAPHGPRDHLGAAHRELTSDLGEEAV